MSSTEILPFGTTFKPLLAASSLSDKDLLKILQSRGIFVGPQKKNRRDTIAILASTLLSPKEFASLSDKQKRRDDKTNTSSIKADWASNNITLIAAMPDDLDEFVRKFLDENENITINSQNCSVLDENKFEIDLTIKRLDWKKDALTNTNFHKCSISVERQGNSLVINTERSVPDTKVLVESLRKAIIEHLIKDGHVDKTKGLHQIMSNSFVSNKSSFLYLISFLEHSFQHLIFERMLNVSAGISAENSLPEKLDWLQKDVAEFSMHGNNIKNTDLVKAGESGALLFGEIEAEFSFSYSLAAGKCIIKYGFSRHFSGKKKLKNVEFEARLTKLTIDNNFNNIVNANAISRTILIEFQKHKHEILADGSYLKTSPENIINTTNTAQLELFQLL